MASTWRCCCKTPPRPRKKAAEHEDYEEKTQPPWVIDRLQFKTDYVGYLDRRRTHIYVLDIASGEMTQLTHGDYDDSEMAWSPDGSRIAFTSNRSEEPDDNYNTDIWVVSAEGGDPLQITTNPGSDDSPAWSPDGRSIAHRAMNHPETRDYSGFDLAVSRADGSGTTILTADLDRWVYQPGWTVDGKEVRFLLESSGEQALASIPPQRW